MSRKKAIGILGGMGPEASVYMYKMLIDLSIKYFGAQNNDDFPEIILYSIPVPDFISSTKEKDKAMHILQKRVTNLNKLPIDSLAIACNTAHVMLPELQKISQIPFISMIDVVVEVLRKDKLKKLGLIGTPMTTKTNLYQKVLAQYSIETVIPTESQIKIQESIIRNVIAGRLLKSDSLKLVRIANSLRKKGVEGIILGCTELPLVFPQKYLLQVFNSVEILAVALLEKYYNGGNT